MRPGTSDGLSARDGMAAQRSRIDGTVENLELSDRAAWFSGVVEERLPDAGR